MRHRTSLIPLIGALAACFNTAEPLASDTGVVVSVALWPVDPVEIEGQPSRTRPVAGARIIVRDAAGRTLAEETTDEAGRARIPLAPGSYVVSVAECPGAMSLPKQDAVVTITASAFASAELTCDTGIR